MAGPRASNIQARAVDSPDESIDWSGTISYCVPYSM